MISKIVSKVFKEMHILERNRDTVIPDFGMGHGVTIIMEKDDFFIQTGKVVDKALGVFLNRSLPTAMLPADEAIIITAFDSGQTFEKLPFNGSLRNVTSHGTEGDGWFIGLSRYHLAGKPKGVRNQFLLGSWENPGFFYGVDNEVEGISPLGTVLAAGTAGNTFSDYLRLVAVHKRFDVGNSLFLVIINVKAFNQTVAAQITF
jgi:hypothetical protein